ncbi:MAG: hypothetical protein M0C28_48775 [Candidatus Moduliflexus flocculans]|nr:hypothetical protein [Candidatus Moduliflexus flocculans]
MELDPATRAKFDAVLAKGQGARKRTDPVGTQPGLQDPVFRQGKSPGRPARRLPARARVPRLLGHERPGDRHDREDPPGRTAEGNSRASPWNTNETEAGTLVPASVPAFRKIRIASPDRRSMDTRISTLFRPRGLPDPFRVWYYNQ